MDDSARSMRIIDLSLPLYTGMPVYPGDPEASIERIQTITERGWELRRIQISSHHGTHVNVPSHGIVGGKTLDEYSLLDFCGRARIHQPHARMSPAEGILFRDRTIDDRIAEEIKRMRPRFIGLSCSYDLDARIEKDLLAAGIISFENLANLNELPESFVFYGMPLRIRGGDGSPVRAFAVIEAST
jgi:arylformamidase